VHPRCKHTRIPTKYIYNYSFAVDPEAAHPTGSINFSRIENVRLPMQFSAPLPENQEIQIYARSQNVVQVYGGVMSLRWAA